LNKKTFQGVFDVKSRHEICFINNCFLFVQYHVSAQKNIVVGISSDPPFIINEKGEISGFSVEIWDAIADSLAVEYSFVNPQSDSIIPDLVQKTVNLSIAPMLVNVSSLDEVYYTEPFYISSMSVALIKKPDDGFWNLLKNLHSPSFLKTIGLLFFINLCVGLLVWLGERKKNALQFPNTWAGLGDGFWWSCVTMTTVGYGDKVPKTGWGRVLATIWMFTSVIIIGGFTATISSELTTNRLANKISEVTDLHGLKVGCLDNNNIDPYLSQFNIKTTQFNTMELGVEALKLGKIDVFVGIDAILSYYIDHHTIGIELIDLPNNKEYLCFASSNKNLIDSINPVLLRLIESPIWIPLLKKYDLNGN
jgi:ABC-type amino acid transport/signal transduction systems, periplasmic component/domain